MSCVPFARQESGIEVAGNAGNWWDNAAGIYARGERPEPGSVLAFASTGHMRLGHVAVVSRLVNAREIAIDQANWGNGGRITRDVSVIDVSPLNDWTSVRVAIGGDSFGSVYPTHGFIYDRPDIAPTLTATAARPAATPAGGHAFGNEVAEAPMGRTGRGIDLTIGGDAIGPAR